MDAETDQYAPELMRDNSAIAPPGTYQSGYHLTEDLVDQASASSPITSQRGPTSPG